MYSVLLLLFDVFIFYVRVFPSMTDGDRFTSFCVSFLSPRRRLFEGDIHYSSPFILRMHFEFMQQVKME